MPFWLVRLMATLTRDQGLKGVEELLSYFEKVGERTSNLGDDSCILGAPTITLDQWLERRKQ